ncbi:MAG: hypothetical protein ABEL76_17165 [Bradymonadaceae bacterium]
MAGLLLAFVVILAAIQQFSSKRLEKRRQKVRRQQKKLRQQERQLRQMRDRISSVLGVRSRLMKRLKKRFSTVGGDIRFDDATGSIRLGSSILFEEGSAKLTPRGKRKLRRYMPIYFEALLGDSDLREHVDRIIVQGHANSNYSGPGGKRAAYLFNLELSQDRAFSAMKYILRQRLGSEYKVRNLLQASGFSFSRKIYKTVIGEDGKPKEVEDFQASRRIEIRFRLKGERALKRLRDMFEGTLDGANGG